MVPPAGGVRVTADAGKPSAPQEPVVRTTVELPDISDSPTEIREARGFAEAVTVVDEPAETTAQPETNFAAAVTEIDEPQTAADVPPPGLTMPVSPAALEVPDPTGKEDEPTDAPPGFESETTALDDSWFGDGLDDEATQPDITAEIPPIEEEPPAPTPEPDFDDVAWDDPAASGGG